MQSVPMVLSGLESTVGGAALLSCFGWKPLGFDLVLLFIHRWYSVPLHWNESYKNPELLWLYILF